MKRFVMLVTLVMVLALALTGTALADDPPTTCPMGNGTPGSGPGPRGGMGPGMGAGMGPGMRGGAADWMGMPDEVETLLGMTEEQIHAERLAGKSLAQIAAAKGISKDTLVATILNAKKADIERLVSEGRLTRQQADFMLARMQQQVTVMVDQTTTGPRMGGWGGGMGGNQTPGQQTPNTAPSAPQRPWQQWRMPWR